MANDQIQFDKEDTTSYKDWLKFQSNVELITKGLSDTANTQLQSETKDQSAMESAQASLNAASTALNGSPANLVRPNLPQVMRVLNAVLIAQFPVPPKKGQSNNGPQPPPISQDPSTGKLTSGGNNSSTAVQLSGSLSDGLKTLVAPAPTGNNNKKESAKSKLQNEISNAELGWLQEALENAIKTTMAAVKTTATGGTNQLLTPTVISSLTISLTDALNQSSLFPQAGSETFLTNLAGLIELKLMKKLPLQYAITSAPVAEGNPPNPVPDDLKDSLKGLIMDVLDELFDTGGAQGAVLTFAAAQENVANLYDYAQDLLSYTPTFETLITKFNASALNTAQDITTANGLVQEFAESYDMTDDIFKEAQQVKQGGYTLNIIATNVGTPNKKVGVAPEVKELKDLENGNLALAELDSVTMAAKAAGLNYSNNTLKADKTDAVSAAQALHSNAQKDFTNAITALTNAMNSYEKDLTTYRQAAHKLKLAETTNTANTEAEDEINQIMDTVLHSPSKDKKKKS